MHYSFFDLYPYILLFLSFLLIAKMRKTEEWKSNACFVILLLFTICRYNVGWDYESYVYTIVNWGEQWDAGRYSIFSNLIFYIGYKLHFYPFVFITYGLIQLILMKYAIDKFSERKVLSWLFFLLIPVLFLQGLSTIRQAVANEFVLVSMLFFLNKDYKKAAFLYFIALQFHASVLLAIFIVPLSLIKISNKINWALFISSFFLGGILVTVLSSITSDSTEVGRFQYYVEEYESHKTSLLNYYYYAINAGLLLFYSRVSKYNPLLGRLITIANFGIVLFNIISFEPITATRLASMYVITWIYVLPFMYDVVTNKVSDKAIDNSRVNYTFVLPFAFVFFFFLMSYVSAFNNHQLFKVSFIPYEFWWNNL